MHQRFCSCEESLNMLSSSFSIWTALLLLFSIAYLNKPSQASWLKHSVNQRDVDHCPTCHRGRPGRRMSLINEARRILTVLQLPNGETGALPPLQANRRLQVLPAQI
jgi:hypothetical protein